MRNSLNLKTGAMGCTGIRLVSDGLNLTLEYEYYNSDQEADFIGRILFRYVVAHRFRRQHFSRGFLEPSYDRIIVNEDLSWKQEILRRGPPDRLLKDVEHFCVFISENGYLEVLASDVAELASRQGVLE